MLRASFDSLCRHTLTLTSTVYVVCSHHFQHEPGASAMTFRWKIVRPFQTGTDNTIMTLPGVEMEFETGSIREAHGIFSDNGSSLVDIFGGPIVRQLPDAINKAETLVEAVVQELPAETKPEAAPAAEPKGRARRAKAEPASAPAPVAIPDPMPVAVIPTTVLPPADLTTTNANGIPAFLDRTAPPPAPPAPPAPPVGVLGGKIAIAIEGRVKSAIGSGQPNPEQAFADWLINPAPAGCGLLKPGATFADAMEGLRFIPDEKLGPIAAQLGVS